MSIAGSVVHRPEQQIEHLSRDGDGSITLAVNSAAIKPHTPNTKWRRLRVTHEWLSGIPQIAASTQSYVAVNWNKHDGSGTYNHYVNAAGTLRNLTTAVGTGAMELFVQCQNGEDPVSGWWHGFFTGYYTVGAGSPTVMSGDYWDFSGRVAFQGPSLMLGATGGTTRQTLAAIWDWPVP